MKIYYVTKNNQKWASANHALKDSGIELAQAALETPEIQSLNGQEIVEFSANWASEKLNQPVVKTDATWSFTGLNGFPGPFAKYAQKWFNEHDLVELLKGKDQTAIVTEYLCFKEPNKAPITFKSECHGTIATAPTPNGQSTFDHLFIPNGEKEPLGDWPKEKVDAYWGEKLDHWKQFKKYLNGGK